MSEINPANQNQTTGRINHNEVTRPEQSTPSGDTKNSNAESSNLHTPNNTSNQRRRSGIEISRVDNFISRLADGGSIRANHTPSSRSSIYEPRHYSIHEQLINQPNSLASLATRLLDDSPSPSIVSKKRLKEINEKIPYRYSEEVLSYSQALAKSKDLDLRTAISIVPKEGDTLESAYIRGFLELVKPEADKFTNENTRKTFIAATFIESLPSFNISQPKSVLKLTKELLSQESIDLKDTQIINNTFINPELPKEKPATLGNLIQTKMSLANNKKRDLYVNLYNNLFDLDLI